MNIQTKINNKALKALDNLSLAKANWDRTNGIFNSRRVNNRIGRATNKDKAYWTKSDKEFQAAVDRYYSI